MTNCNYFGYCPESGFETFKTEKEAKEYAQSSIDDFRDYADEGWSEEVHQVCWGEIKEATAKCNEKTIEQAKEEGFHVTSDCSGWCDYELQG